MRRSRFRFIAIVALLTLFVAPLLATFCTGSSAYAFAPDTDLSQADASFWGEDASDHSGYSVATAGDVNGDGYDDFLIGALFNGDGGFYAGQTYLILGKPSGWAMDTGLLNADASFIGEAIRDQSGVCVATAGDVNGDGCDDFLIGAYRNDHGGSDAGQTYLILGRGAADWGMDYSLSNADASFWGEDAYDRSGRYVATAGDVNGDGCDDFLIGAPHNDHGGTDAGQTYLILGKPSGWAMDQDLGTPGVADASFWGEDANDYSGYSVATAGDVNGDGYDDFLINAYRNGHGGEWAGQTYLILGKPSGWAPDTGLSQADASFWGEDAKDMSGWCVAMAGDVNGDGYDDFFISAPYNDAGGNIDAGQTYLFLGRAKTDLTWWGMDYSLSNADASFIGEDAEDRSGCCVATAGDVNSDGYDDFLIGAYGDDDGGDTAGQTYLILGKASGWAMDTDLLNADASFIGEDVGDKSGYSVATAGDVNGDGYDDFLINAPYNDAGGNIDAGQTYLIFGSNAAPDAPISPLCEGQDNPTGVGDTTPEFSWTFSDPDAGNTQSAYRILVASTSVKLAADNGDKWDSSKVISSSSSDISYAGSSLSWETTYYWKVKTWDNQDAEGPYCSEQIFTMQAAPPLDIDIKPGSYPNSINTGSKGVIPVAILTTDDFDAATVDPSTVLFGPSEAAPVHWALEDVDCDGDIDMILHFKTQETGISPGDTEATLTGKTLEEYGAQNITGTDSVRAVPPKVKK